MTLNIHFDKAVSQVLHGVHTTSFCASEYPTEDRLSVEEWNLPGGCWKYLAVFNGHGAGVEAVEFASKTLPRKIKDSLSGWFDQNTTGLGSDDNSESVSRILIDCVSELDNQIREDLLALFSPDQIPHMADDEIKSVLKDPNSPSGQSRVEVLRARTGTTALITLVNPSGWLHVASLGDCDALLVFPHDAVAGGKSSHEVLSTRHACRNKAEADRVKLEHPDEGDIIDEKSGRLFGIPLTRCLGDFLWKLPPAYTSRVFAQATPPFHPNYPWESIAARILTPPYLSNAAEVKHFNLNTINSRGRAILTMCSDGLPDLYKKTSSLTFEENIIRWHDREVLGHSGRCANLARSLLWDALGGNDDGNLVRHNGRYDDTSIVVMRF